MAVYKVVWKKGIPYIKHGKIVVIGPKKKCRRIQWNGENKTENLNSGAQTIKQAIENDIFWCSKVYGNTTIFGRQNRYADAWQLAYCINQITRLYRKLEKHNLV